MARKRASLAGHGMEILFGAGDDQRSNGTRHASPPKGTSPTRDASGREGTPAAEAVIRGDWWAALEAEAKSAMPAGQRNLHPAEVPDQTRDMRRFVTSWMDDGRDTPFAPDPAEPEGPSPAGVPAPAPESQPPLAAAPSFSEDALPPLATTPALEPETSPSTIYAAPVAGSPETGVAAGSRATAPSGDPFEPDGPRSSPLDLRELGQVDQGQHSRVRDEDEVLAYVGDEQRQLLWKEIVSLYEEVPKVLINDELQDEALQLLQGAQDILMERPRQFDVAQYKVGQVESILTRRKQTVRWTNTYGWLTFLYEAAWVVVLAVAIFYAPAIVASITATFGAAESLISVEQLWNTAAWGGAGGVLGALYSLYWHAAKVKDFDRQYLMWYVVQPVIGLIIGAALHVIIGAGFLTLVGERAIEQGTPLRLFPYALAVIAAFRQRFILEVVDRVIQFVTRTGDLGKGGGTAEPEEGTPSSRPAG